MLDTATTAMESPKPDRRQGARRAPLRRCLCTGESGPARTMIRFVIDPAGMLVPDIRGDLPGRGFWLTARREMVEAARAGNLFAKVARTPVAVPEGLADRVEALLAANDLHLVGLARRAGQATSGFRSVGDWLRRGRAGLLLEAVDGGRDGAERIGDAAARAGLPVIRLFRAAELGRVFGRDIVVHAAIGPGRLAGRIGEEAARLAGFRDSGRSEIKGQTADD